MPHEPPSIGTYLAVILGDVSDNEVIVALRRLRKLVKAAGIDGHDIGKAVEQNPELLKAAKGLKVERDRLLAENERLQRLQQANGAGNSFAAQLWQTAGMPTSVDSRHALWLRDLNGRGLIHLTAKEIDFIDSCTRRRRLTDPMKDWLHDIVQKAIARTGQAPPP